jgi:acetyltransferase
MRFFVPKRTLPHTFAARMTQIDYDRDMALVLVEPGIPGQVDVYALVSIAADPDGEQAEYAIMVRTDMTGRGLGSLLSGRIIEYCRRRGFKEIVAQVLRENRAMLRLSESLGFRAQPNPEDPGVLDVRLTLAAPGASA